MTAAAGPEGGTTGSDAAADIVAHFRASLDLIGRYPVVAAPMLIAMLVGFGLMIVLFGGSLVLLVGGGVMGQLGLMAGGLVLLLLFVSMLALVNLVACAVVIVMASEALAGREPSMGAALGAVVARLADVVIASLTVTVIVGIASLFLVLPGLVAAFFLMFTLPAVLLSELGAFAAIGRSARLVRDNLGLALGLAIGGLVAVVAMMLVSMILGIVPILGHLSSMLLSGALFAYLTLVAVRVYRTLPHP